MRDENLSFDLSVGMFRSGSQPHDATVQMSRLKGNQGMVNRDVRYSENLESSRFFEGGILLGESESTRN
jgi:hypothetical protein